MQNRVTSLLLVQLLLLCGCAQNQGLDAGSLPHFTHPSYNATIFENSLQRSGNYDPFSIHNAVLDDGQAIEKFRNPFVLDVALPPRPSCLNKAFNNRQGWAFICFLANCRCGDW